MPPGIRTRTSCPLFEHYDCQFIADGRLSNSQLLRGTCNALVQAQTGFNTDNQQIKHVWKPSPNSRLTGGNSIAQPEVRQEISKSHRYEVHEEWTITSGSGKECRRAKNERDYRFCTIKEMNCGVAAISSPHQTLLHHGDLCLAFRYNTLQLLHHNTQCGACLLHRLAQTSLFLPGGDHGGYPLDHGLTIEQNQSAARDQQENGNKT